MASGALTVEQKVIIKILVVASWATTKLAEKHSSHHKTDVLERWHWRPFGILSLVRLPGLLGAGVEEDAISTGQLSLLREHGELLLQGV